MRALRCIFMACDTMTPHFQCFSKSILHFWHDFSPKHLHFWHDFWAKSLHFWQDFGLIVLLVGVFFVLVIRFQQLGAVGFRQRHASGEKG